MSRITTYILVILVLVFGALALIVFQQSEAEQRNVQFDNDNQSLKLSLLSLTEGDHVMGNADGRIIVVEYADSDCPFCAALLPKLYSLVRTYPEDVAWVYRHSQLAIYPNSHKEAEAMECVYELGGEEAYRQFRDRMYDQKLTGVFEEDATYLSNLAVELDIERFSFIDCYEGERYRESVQTQKNIGAALKVSTVPHTFIVDTLTGEVIEVVGNKPLEIYTTIIDALLSS